MKSNDRLTVEVDLVPTEETVENLSILVGELHAARAGEQIFSGYLNLEDAVQVIVSVAIVGSWKLAEELAAGWGLDDIMDSILDLVDQVDGNTVVVLDNFANKVAEVTQEIIDAAV